MEKLRLPDYFAEKKPRVKNYLRATYFKEPDWIPCTVGLMPATWKKYREDLEEIVLDHPDLFPNYEQGSRDFDDLGDRRYQPGQFTDNWGCLWDNIAPGLDGAVVGHPLEDWADFPDYEPPDPIEEGDGWTGSPPDWEEIEREIKRAKEEGRLARGGLNHGFMYMRLYYLRGFNNLMLDFAREDPRLDKLIDTVLEYNMAQIEKYLELGVEFMYFGGDLGLQDRLPIKPEKFRQYLKPCYEKMYGRCKEEGVGVYQHSDGHILEIIPDLVDCGLDIINPQFRANGLDGLEEVAKGKVCINLDLDRQLLPFTDPQGVREHVKEAVERLNTPQGGLMLYGEAEPDVPLENIRAICETFEEIGGGSF